MAAATQVSSMLMTHMNTVLNIQIPAGRSNRRVSLSVVGFTGNQTGVALLMVRASLKDPVMIQYSGKIINTASTTSRRTLITL